MPKARPPYSPEFRRQLVDLVRAGRSPEDLAREFEPTAQLIAAWVAAADKQEGRREGAIPGLASFERDELARLRRESKPLRLERDVLSTSAAQRASCGVRNGRRYDWHWRGAAVRFLVVLNPVLKHGPWAAAYLRVVTPLGDPG